MNRKQALTLKKRLINLSLCVIASLPLGAYADTVSKDDLASLMASAQRAKDATVKMDAAAIVESTHPAVISMSGGKDNLIDMIQTGLAQMKSKGVEFLSFDVSPPQCEEKIPHHRLCFIPTATSIKVDDHTVKGKSYLVAVRDAETSEKWLFIDGSGEKRNPGMLRKLLPWIPEKVTFPDPS